MIDLSSHVYKRLNSVIRETIRSTIHDHDLDNHTPDEIADLIMLGVEDWIAAIPVRNGIAKVVTTEREKWRKEVEEDEG